MHQEVLTPSTRRSITIFTQKVIAEIIPIFKTSDTLACRYELTCKFVRQHKRIIKKELTITGIGARALNQLQNALKDSGLIEIMVVITAEIK